ncbi:MAG: asparaginase [Gammaproteobacteria bacterium]|nr:asparaginase [Gammaproteobacteria bacterium]
MSTSLPNIVVLATGGTIASQGNSPLSDHYQNASIGIETLLADLPELNQVANISTEQIAQIESQHISEDIWFSLARRIMVLVNCDDVDGVVITHGTDTLEETAYFLNLVLNTSKPVVLTGAMRPANALSSDGPKNLLSAIVVAKDFKVHGKGVLVVMNNTVHAARMVSKMHVSSLDSFESPILGMLGSIEGPEVVFYQQPTRRHTYQSEFKLEDISSLPRVDIVYGYAFNDSDRINAVVNLKAKGIVSAGMGRGQQNKATCEALIKAREQGVLVVRSSRINGGIIARDPGIDDAYDFIAGDNLNPQKARVLLSLALTKTQDSKIIQQMFNSY